MGWVFVSFRVFFAGRTVIRRKEGWHPGRERAPSPGGAGRGSPAPAGKADPAGFWPAKSWDSLFPEPIARRKVPRRRKAPDFSNSDVQRATLAIHSLGLVCVFFLFFVFFCFCFSVFVPSAPMEMLPLPLALGPWAKEPQVRARVRPPGSGIPQPGRVLRSPAPGKTPVCSVAAEPIPPEARSRAKTRRPGTARLLRRLPLL